MLTRRLLSTLFAFHQIVSLSRVNALPTNHGLRPVRSRPGKSSRMFENYANSANPPPITVIPCAPQIAPYLGQIGFCVPPENLKLCRTLYGSVSSDCPSAEYFCCYVSQAYNDYTAYTTPSMTFSTPTSTVSSTTVPITSANYFPTNESMSALVIQQICGVPNGDPTIFISIEQPNTAPQSMGFDRSRNALRKKTPRLTVHDTIIGGFEAPNGTASLCWQVSTVRDGNDGFEYFCGGTIIGSRTILTAAHCMITEGTVAQFNSSANPTEIQIGVISRDINGAVLYPDFVSGCEASFTVALSMPHPNYDPDTNDNDVALLILTEPIDFRASGECACKICLTEQIPAVGDTCITSGFGAEVDPSSSSPPPRSAIPLKYVAQQIVASSYTTCPYYITPQNETTDLNLFLCAGGVIGENSCQGDSGGPLFCYNSTTKNQYLAGIVSFGDACGAGFPNVYTKVAKYLDWIFQTAPLGDISVMI